MRNYLNFDLLPNVTSMGILRQLDPDVREVLNDDCDLVELNDRADCALYLLSRANSDNGARYNSAFLRSGLNEFYSLEDAARRDCRAINRSLSPVRIRESQNPLVHLMYLLRHANVHASISKTTAHNTTVISRFSGDKKEIDWVSIILDKPTLEQLVQCKKTKQLYHQEQLAKAAEWLDENQMTFGIGELFMKGVSSYCREVLMSINRLNCTQQFAQADA